MDHLLETSFLKIKTLLLHVCSGVRVRVLILVGGSFNGKYIVHCNQTKSLEKIMQNCLKYIEQQMTWFFFLTPVAQSNCFKLRETIYFL